MDIGQTDSLSYKDAWTYLKWDLFWNVANLAFDRVSQQQTDKQSLLWRCKGVSERFVLNCCQPCIWQGIPAAGESEKAVEEVYDLLRNLPKYKAEILKEAIDGK